MFKVKSNEEIGAYLKNIIDEKYESVRKFCKEFLLETDVEQSHENIGKMQNKISQILKGKKGVQTYDLPIFCKLLDKSCEAILSAGEVFVPEVNRMTNYLIAFSKDENEWKKFIEREDKLILNPDEYGKNAIDYALEFKNHAFIRFLIDEGYITLILQEKAGVTMGDYVFGVKTSIKSRNINLGCNIDYYLLSQLNSTELRQAIIELALEYKDIELLSRINARETPELYIGGAFRKVEPCEYIDSLSKADDKILEYFTDEFDINVPIYREDRNDFITRTVIFPSVAELAKKLISNKSDFAKMALEKISRHNANVYYQLKDCIDESIKKNHEKFTYERTEKEIYNDEIYGIDLATNVFNFCEENGFIHMMSDRTLGNNVFTNIIKLDFNSGDEKIDKLIEEVNQYYKKVVNIREDYKADARRKYLNEHI